MAAARRRGASGPGRRGAPSQPVPLPALPAAREGVAPGADEAACVPASTDGGLLPGGGASRAAICGRLGATPFLPHTHELFMHGRGYDGPVKPPKVLWKSASPPRQDHSCPEWLTATEFEDLPDVADAKAAQLALLLLCSKKTVAYTGAGISASVVGQAALSGQNKVGWVGNPREAQPTPTHYILSFLARQGLLHGWVQQNHDGLPQKAGFPQENINEIHGSWYDPSNPVVKYSGSLHDRSFAWMEDDANTADLCLVLGTSLGGLNADQLPVKTARRSVDAVSDDLAEKDGDGLGESEPAAGGRALGTRCRGVGGGLGTVIMNLQQTAQDGKMTLRMFGKSDDILRMLLLKLGVSTEVQRPPSWPKDSRALVPYDAEGRRLPTPGGKRMWLDLRNGQLIRITPGHNIQGAKQPQYMHIGASKPVKSSGGSTRQPGPGLGKVLSRSRSTASFMLEVEGASMQLGIWWLESAMRGGVAVLPVVNQRPLFEE